MERGLGSGWAARWAAATRAAARLGATLTLTGSGHVVLPSGRPIPLTALLPAQPAPADVDAWAAAAVTAWLASDLFDPSGPAAARLQVHAVSRGHVLHPGPGWVQRRVPGGVLDVGWAIRSPATRDGDPLARPVPVFPWALSGHPAEADDRWGAAVTAHEIAGRDAADAAARTAHASKDSLHGRPVTTRAGYDVPTLLASTAFRRGLAAGADRGMVGFVAPTLDSGWVLDRAVDAQFAEIVAAATPSPERGVDGVVLMCVDEVSPAPSRRRVAAR